MSIREKVSAALKEKTGAGFVGLGIADTAINAFLAAAAEQGWHMRPDEATEEMINGAAQTRKMQAVNAAMTLAQIHGAKFEATSWHDSALADAYRAMHAAAPKFEWDK